MRPLSQLRYYSFTKQKYARDLLAQKLLKCLDGTGIHPDLYNVIESCTEPYAKNRPAWEWVIATLEDIIIDLALPCPQARALWHRIQSDACNVAVRSRCWCNAVAMLLTCGWHAVGMLLP